VPRSTLTLLDHEIARQPVDARAAADQGLFSVPDGVRPLIDKSFGDFTLDMVDWPAAIENASGRIDALCGPSRDRRKAGAAAFQLHLSLAAAGVAVPHVAVVALGRALGLDEDLALLETRTTGIHGHWADAWLNGDERALDRPSVAEMVALRIITFMGTTRRAVRAPLKARRAVFALLTWYRAHRCTPPVVAINALGVVVGVLDATAKLGPAAQRSFHHDADRLRQHATIDARSRIVNGSVAAPKAHIDESLVDSDLAEQRRVLSRMRAAPVYGRAVDDAERTVRAQVAERLADDLSIPIERARLESSVVTVKGKTEDLRMPLGKVRDAFKALSPDAFVTFNTRK